MFENKENSRTSLQDIGEFGLIDHLTQHFKIIQPTTIRGVGDDAAVLRFKDEDTIVTTDLLVEGVHFDLGYMPLKHLGYKAVMVNLSDVYAMNAKATQITVSIAVSNRFPLEALEELYSGIALACELYQVDLVGGDTTSSTKGMLICVTAIGTAKKEEVVYRSGAKPNDLLVVTGDLGGAYLGLQVLKREQEVFAVNPENQPDLSPYAYLVERQLKPEARKDIIELFKKLEVQPTSMIDISDGLSSEVLHFCKASDVGCFVYEDKIPLDPNVISTCEEFNLDSSLVALSGGEDYELLFTIDQKKFPKIKGNPNFTVLGHVTEKEEGAYLISRNNSKIPLTAQGWNAFTSE
ncbi:MAG: thiamine-phosphate kinase [Eudoraea sp.]|nr:thiamine-phosphate kinase [Eudoraea sp.]